MESSSVLADMAVSFVRLLADSDKHCPIVSLCIGLVKGGMEKAIEYQRQFVISMGGL